MKRLKAVTAVAASGAVHRWRQRSATARAGSSGTFSVRLPAGTYDVLGRSPHVIEVSDGVLRPAPCSQQVSVTVTPRHTTRITLICIVP